MLALCIIIGIIAIGISTANSKADRITNISVGGGSDLPNERDFMDNYGRMLEVVKSVEAGRLKTRKDYQDLTGLLGERIKLPEKYKYLSLNGEIIYENKEGVVSILFVTNTDILAEQNYGYLYRSNNELSESGKKGYFSEGAIGYHKKLKDKWFMQRISF
jgi:hypothetical protein